MVLILLGAAFVSSGQSLFAKETYDPQKAEELMRSADRLARIGYILAGIGATLIIAAIPIGFYWDRKKNRRIAPPPATPQPERPPRPHDDH